MLPTEAKEFIGELVTIGHSLSPTGTLVEINDDGTAMIEIPCQCGKHKCCLKVDCENIYPA